MARVLNKRDILEILYGVTLMGAGGGGSLENGLFLLKQVEKNYKIELTMIHPDEMAPNSYAAVVCGMGAPSVLKQSMEQKVDKIIQQTEDAFNGLEKLAFLMNRNVKYAMAVEYGGFNTFLTMMACITKGIPFVDADGCGRAVPALETLLFGVNGIATSPTVMTDGEGSLLIGYTADPFDARKQEEICRGVCTGFGMIMGLAGWMSTQAEIKEKLFVGAYTHAQKVGAAFLNAIEKKLDISAEISKVTEYRELWQGRVTQCENVAKGGFDYGRNYFEGIGKYAGKKYRIDFQNENLVAFEGDKPVLTVPDLICFCDLETGTPLTNADVKEGMNILVCAMPANEAWFYNDEGINCWKSFLDTIEYKGGTIRY